MKKLLYVGQQVADDLRSKISENIELYKSSDFLDFESRGDWRIPLSIDADLERLQELNTERGPEAEITNSTLVGEALRSLTPTLARENRLWIRLSHVEALDYSRKRWIPDAGNDETISAAIAKHFFAPTLTGCRDDHSVSRLWWNYQIAKQILPADPERVLKSVLARADIRLNFLERPGIAARPLLGLGIIRALEKHGSLLNGESLFRAFMRQVNLSGAGVAFEVWSDGKVDDFMARCLDRADGEISASEA